jgi:hypothetical protein
MTLDTTVRTPGPVNLDELRAFCATQLNATGLWIHEPSDAVPDHILLTPVERCCVGGAHLSILYIPIEGASVRSVQVGWITGWGSISPAGERPVALHDRLIRELSAWLLERGLTAEVSTPYG